MPYAQGAGISAVHRSCAHGESHHPSAPKPSHHPSSPKPRPCAEAIGDPGARAPRASGFPLTRAALAGMTRHVVDHPTRHPRSRASARLSGIQPQGHCAHLDSRSALRLAGMTGRVFVPEARNRGRFLSRPPFAAASAPDSSWRAGSRLCAAPPARADRPCGRDGRARAVVCRSCASAPHRGCHPPARHGQRSPVPSRGRNR